MSHPTSPDGEAEARAMTDQRAEPPWAARTYDPTWRCCRVIDHHNGFTVCHVFGKPKTALIRATLFAAAPATAAERDRLQLEIEQCHAKSTCCCGDYMKHHSTHSGHNPVSMYDSALFNIEAERDRLKVVIEGLADALEKMMAGIHAMREGDVPPLELWQELWDEARAVLDEARK